MDRNIQTKDIPKRRKMSLSARRAWIEIPPADTSSVNVSASLSARRAWIEISGVDFAEDWLNASLSARRAWIEIKYAL